MRRLEDGEMSWDHLVCAQGTEDWVPAHVYQDVIDARGRERREARAMEGRLLARAALMTPPEKRGGGPAWLAACAFGIMGLALGIVGCMAASRALVFLSGIPALACCVCGVVLALQGSVVRGVTAVMLTVLLWPVGWFIAGG